MEENTKMFELELNVGQRIAIAQILRSNKSNDIEVLIDLNKKAKSIYPTVEELKQVGFNEDKQTGVAIWDDKLEFTKTISISETTIRMFIDRIKEKAKNSELTAGNELYLTTYEKLSKLTN